MSSDRIASGTPAYRRLSLAMLLAGLATFAIFYCVQPLLPLFSRDYGVSAEEASLVVSVTIGPMAVALVLAGIVSERVGRRPLMIGSLFAAGIATLLCAVAPSWPALLTLRLAAGLSLAGIPAVAMTYIVEEVDDASAGKAMGLYIAGTAMGGMTGRLLGSMVAEPAGWRVALGVIGASVLGIAVLFWRCVPRSSHFTPRRQSIGDYRDGMLRLLDDRAVPWLLAEAFLLMGAFITIYNYASYRLVDAPYRLSQSLVGAIFLLYILGSFSSTLAGTIAGRVGAPRALRILLLLFLCGIVLTAFAALPIVILGIAVVTIGFFGAHSIASAWVGRCAGNDRAQASAFYMLFYYLGGSLLGPVGGFAWTHGRWSGVAIFAGGLIAAATLISLRLRLAIHGAPALRH